MRTSENDQRHRTLQTLVILLSLCLTLTACGQSDSPPNATIHSTSADTESLILAPTSIVFGPQHYDLVTASASMQLTRSSTMSPRSRIVEFINLPDDWATITRRGVDTPPIQHDQTSSTAAGSDAIATRTDGGIGSHNLSNMTPFAIIALVMVLTIGVWPSQFGGDGMTGLVIAGIIWSVLYTFLADWTPPYQLAFSVLLIMQLIVFGYVKRVGYAVFESRYRLITTATINTVVALALFMLAIVEKPHINTIQWSSAHALSGYIAAPYRYQLILEDADQQPLQTIHALQNVDGWLVIAWTDDSEPRFLRATSATGDELHIALAERPTNAGDSE